MEEMPDDLGEFVKQWYIYEANGVKIMVHPGGQSTTYTLGFDDPHQSASLITHADIEWADLEIDFREGTDLKASDHSHRFHMVEDDTDHIYIAAMFAESEDGTPYPQIEMELDRPAARQLFADLLQLLFNE